MFLVIFLELVYAFRHIHVDFPLNCIVYRPSHLALVQSFFSFPVFQLYIVFLI